MDISKEKFKKYLDLLSRDQPKILFSVQDNSKSQYYVNVASIMKIIKERTVDNIVREKFGKDCARIFRLLLTKKHLEEQLIADMAMLPLKDTRVSLYTLLGQKLCSHARIS